MPLRSIRSSNRWKDGEKRNQGSIWEVHREILLSDWPHNKSSLAAPPGIPAKQSSSQRVALLDSHSSAALSTSKGFKWMVMNWVNESPPQALVQAVNAILQHNLDALLQALQGLRLSIQDITTTLGQMHGMGLPQGEGSAWEQRAWGLSNTHKMALEY